MDDFFQAFQEKFKVAAFKIHSNETWTLSLRPNQPTLGSCIISLNRPLKSFAKITPEEAIGLNSLIGYTDQQLSKAFAFDKINYLMLMMVDDHVHFHVIPRYAEDRMFEGEAWLDTAWQGPPELGGKAIDLGKAKALIAAIQDA